MNLLTICRTFYSYISGQSPFFLLNDPRKDNSYFHVFTSRVSHGGRPEASQLPIANVLDTPIVTNQVPFLVSDVEQRVAASADPVDKGQEVVNKDQALELATTPESNQQNPPTFQEFDDILCELETLYNLDRHNPRVRERVRQYAALLTTSLALQLEHACETNHKFIEIKGSLIPTNSCYPFTIFKQHIEAFVDTLCPGAQVSFSKEEQSARFLAQDMRYSFKTTIRLPSAPFMPVKTGLHLDTIRRTLSSHGLTTGHMRYLQLYQDMVEHAEAIGTNPDILLIGIGLQNDGGDRPDRFQCPQLYEVAALLPHRSSLTALEIDPDVAQAVHKNIHLKQQDRSMRYDSFALSPYFMQHNQFRHPDLVQALIDFMKPGMEKFAASLARTTVVRGDLCTFNCKESQYNLIIATNSISNAFDLFDNDPRETKMMIDILTKYVKSLKENGILYLDEAVFKRLERQLGEGYINRLVLPALRYGSKSEVSLRYLEPAVTSDPRTGFHVINATLVNTKGLLDVVPTNTHGVWALQKGRPDPAPSTGFLPELIRHYRESLGLCKKKIELGIQQHQ